MPVPDKVPMLSHAVTIPASVLGTENSKATGRRICPRCNPKVPYHSTTGLFSELKFWQFSPCVVIHTSYLNHTRFEPVLDHKLYKPLVMLYAPCYARSCDREIQYMFNDILQTCTFFKSPTTKYCHPDPTFTNIESKRPSLWQDL